MRTTVKTLTIILATVLSSATMASASSTNVAASKELNVQLASASNDYVHMIFAKPAGEKVRISIKSSENDVLYYKTIKNETEVLKRFNISELPAGDYTYEVTNGKFTIKKTFSKK